VRGEAGKQPLFDGYFSAALARRGSRTARWSPSRKIAGAATIGPLPFRRLAAAYPDTVDQVFRQALRRPRFTWAEHGESLMRRRKPWYYKREPRPGCTVIGARLSKLLGRQPGQALIVDTNDQPWKLTTEMGPAMARP
jgi:hypothetical protein